MKHILLVLIMCMCLLLTACAGGKGPSQEVSEDSSSKELTKELQTDVEDSGESTVVGDENYDSDKMKVSVTDFAVRLFQENIEKELADGQKQKNVLISPVSVLSALGMTSIGACEETLSQMEAVIGVSRENLNRYIREEFDNSTEELCLANSIWLIDDENFMVKPEFLQFNKECFDAEIYESAFDETTLKDINAWVERKTDGTIKEILNEIPENAVMYLINALVFEAEWQEHYTEQQIQEGTFTTQEGIEQRVEMMNGTEFLYVEDENATGFIKYYKDKKYAFVALLPNEGMDVYHYAKTLMGEHLTEMLSNPTEVKVYTRIPQFSYDYNVEMQYVLKDMGMVDLFDVDKSNLNDLGIYKDENIYVNRVLHKTFIQVTPVGTKAGAATVAEPVCGAAFKLEEVKEVYLERPFIYMIIDCENNQPVFMGTLNSVE